MATGQSKGFEFIESLAKELSTNSLIFPTSMNITMRIRSALNNPDSSIDKAALIVGAEPVLSAHLLRLANAAAMNTGGKPVVDLRTAITRLGYTTVRNVAISVGMRQLSQASTQGAMQPRVQKLWDHSIRVASISYILAKKRARINPDEAMLAGLLHDIGEFYILTRVKDFPDIFADDSAIEEISRQWQDEVGQAILESWEIPEGIADAVRNHTLVSRTHSGPADLTDVVMVANILSGEGMPENLDWEKAPPAFGLLKLDSETCATTMMESEEEIRLIAQALG